MDELNLFTGGWFEEGQTHDDVLALFTDGWFDLGVITIAKRWRTAVNITTILRFDISIATIKRSPIGIATIRRSIFSG